MKKLFFFAPLVALISCSQGTPKVNRYKASIDELPAPELGEVWGGKQEAQTEVILDDMVTLIKKRDADKLTMSRDAHPKSHGCAKAYFGVTNKNLPQEYRVGIFSNDKKYEAWVRYSNGNTTIAPDIVKDVRGMAVKIMNVKDTPTGSQDFLMINAREFITEDGDEYAALFKALKKGGLGMAWFAVRHPKSTYMLSKAMIQIGNPLAVPYFSSVPYKLGPSSMRFSAVPCGSLDNSLPKNDIEDNYLQRKLVDTLKTNDVCFNFYVQPNKDPENNPVEDPRQEWSEVKSPSYHVGTITLSKQEGIDSKNQQNFCENLSYDPWHSHAQTRPLGQINRMRGLIYKEISRIRHETNRAVVKEPTSF